MFAQTLDWVEKAALARLRQFLPELGLTPKEAKTRIVELAWAEKALTSVAFITGWCARGASRAGRLMNFDAEGGYRSVSNSMGRFLGPLMPPIGFHGAGPTMRGFSIRRTRIFSATASSSLAKLTPRQ